jgi:metal-responsive CopG/Arc/MetJ family transcriptional regulator
MCDNVRIKGSEEMAKNKQISVTLAPNILHELESIAKQNGVKKSAIISLAVNEYVQENTKQYKYATDERGQPARKN